MPAPEPTPIQTDQLHGIAHETIKAAKFPQLATIDIDGQQPRLRPVSPVRVDQNFTIHIASLKSYQKTQQLAQNPKVELCYLAPNHDQVRVTGTTSILTDPKLTADIWQTNPLLRQYLKTPDNPDLIIYTITPTKVCFMREWALSYHNVPLP